MGFCQIQNKNPFKVRGSNTYNFDHLDPDSILREDLQLGSVIRNVSEELSLVAIPLHAVQSVTLHVKPGEQFI